MKILFVVPCNPYFPSGLVRVNQFFPFLDKEQIDYHWFNFNSARVQKWLHRLDQTLFAKNRFTDLFFRILIHLSGIPYRWVRIFQILFSARKYDLLFFQSVFFPVWMTKLIKLLNPAFVYDFDDALYLRNAKRIEAVTQNAWKVIVGSHELFDFVKKRNPQVILIPSSVQYSKYSSSKINNSSRPLRIGWIGGTSTLKYLSILIEPLKNLSSKGFKFELVIAGTHGNQKLIPPFCGIEIMEIAKYSGEQIPELVNLFDIGVMPMWDEPWERAKCAMKAVIYMAGGLPAVCSPVGENRYVVREGENGFLANTPEEWEEKLALLLSDSSLRAKMGCAGKALVHQYYSDVACFQILKQEILDQVEKRKPVVS